MPKRAAPKEVESSPAKVVHAESAASPGDDDQPVFIFAHGAGAGSQHPWMQTWAGYLRKLGTVEMLDYPYMKEGRKVPDRQPKLIAAHIAAIVCDFDRCCGQKPMTFA